MVWALFWWFVLLPLMIAVGIALVSLLLWPIFKLLHRVAAVGNAIRGKLDAWRDGADSRQRERIQARKASRLASRSTR